MSFLENNIENCKIGFDGEQLVRDLFIKKKIPFMQVDIMFKYKDKWCLGEVKTQEKFLAPPFDGHGLPKWQIDKRLEFYKDTGVEPYLIINDIHDKCLYIESFNNLLSKEYFQTKGIKPRIVFNLKSFKKVNLENN
jgi:hypothetical protein